MILPFVIVFFFYSTLFLLKKVDQKTGFFVDPAYDPGGVGVKNTDGVGVYIYGGVLTPAGSGSRK